MKPHNEIISGVNSIQDTLAKTGIMTVAFIYFHDDNTSRVLSNLRVGGIEQDLNHLSRLLIKEIVPNHPMSSNEKLKKYVNKENCSCLIFGMMAGTEERPQITYYFESSVSRSKNNLISILKRIRKGFINDAIKKYLDLLSGKLTNRRYYAILYFHDDNSYTIFSEKESKEYQVSMIERIIIELEFLKGKEIKKMGYSPFESVLTDSNTTLIRCIEVDNKLIVPWISDVDNSPETILDVIKTVLSRIKNND